MAPVLASLKFTIKAHHSDLENPKPLRSRRRNGFQKRQKKYLRGRAKRLKADQQPATRGELKSVVEDFIPPKRA
jgi:hypothetical protein